MSMYFVESKSFDPAFNLATEEYLFRNLPPGSRCFMLWQNRDAVIVGKYQNSAEEIDQDYVQSHGVAVVRRLSGGGAVYHDLGNLNYSIIEDGRRENAATWQGYMEPLLSVLQGYGLPAHCSGRNDLLIGEKKIAGCAQYASGGRVLHHGCILLDVHPEKLEAALRTSRAKYESRSVKSVRSRVASINACLEEPISMERFREDVARAYLSRQEVREFPLEEKDLMAIETLAEERYRSWEWNYGFQGTYRVHKERRFDAGLVQLSMNVKEGKIEEARIHGDFFGGAELAPLEEALRGLPLDEVLTERLAALGVENYIHGLKPEELARLLLD